MRSELVGEYVCRLVNHMDAIGVSQCTPRLREQDQGMATHPMIEDFSPGYMQRGMHLFPKQGDRDPWRNTQNYALDKETIRNSPIKDGVLDFSNPPAVSVTAEPGPEGEVRRKSAA